MSRQLVCLIDDDEAFRQSLEWMLRAAGLEVSSYESAEAFLAAYTPGAAACLIVDVRMPGLNGLQLHDELIRRGERMATIFMTAHGDVPLAVRAVKHGAFDFVEKPFAGQCLIALVRKALRADPVALTAAADRSIMTARIASLSDREHLVMVLVLQGKTNKLIARELGISVKTVESHRARMMEKLGVESIAELVRNVFFAAVPNPPA